MTLKMRHMGVAVALLLAFVPKAGAQKWSVSTNLVGYLHFGTFNAEVSYGPLQHWSFSAAAKYNPFTFHSKNGQYQLRQQTAALSARWWPWHVWSGWWVAARLQYQEYNSGGLISSRTEEGDRVGVGFAGGYTYMLHPHLNIEFGLGFWTGGQWYTAYSCPKCGMTLESGFKGFILPNDLIVSLCYVF